MCGTTGKTLCKFADVERAEHERLRKIREQQGREAVDQTGGKLTGLTGLALSGGGIRAAAFGLGVLHSLKKRGLHHRLDYLSTVSGGGYIGAAWSYVEALRAEQKAAEPDVNCSLDRILPLGARHVGGKLDRLEQNRYLDHIRGHGHYLEIGHQLGFGSLVAMLLRSIMVGLLIWLPLAILGLSLLATVLDAVACGISWLWPSPAATVVEPADGGSTEASSPVFGESIGLLLPAALALLGIMALFAVWRCVAASSRGIGESYVNRITQQRHLGRLWRWTLGFAVLGSLPAATALMRELPTRLIEGSLLAGPLGVLGGALTAWILIRKADRLQEGGIGGWRLLANLGAGLMLLGSLFVAFELARHLNDLGRWLLDWVAVSRWATDPVIAEIFGLVPAIFLGLAALAIAARTDINIIALNRLYRDRLMEAFLPNPKESGKWHKATEADTFWLWRASPANGKAPYHLINTHVILTRSASTRHAGRGGDSFVLSPLYCGSDATDWCPTKEWIRRKDPDDYLSLPTAMAISGAAINPNAGESGRGPTRLRFVAMAMSLLNLRLAYWVPNPCKCRGKPVSPRVTWLKIGPDVLLGNAHKETNGFVELSDGQHFEGLGLYELIRRRVEIIVVADATCDPAFRFQALGNAIERCRVDFGVDIRFDDRRFCLDDLLPRPKAPHIPLEAASFAHAGVAIARIDYPRIGCPEGGCHKPDCPKAGCPQTCCRKSDCPKIKTVPPATGHLVYIKSTLIRDLPPDLLAYKLGDPTFPDQSTLDQWFDEAQFEAYRELGYGLFESFMRRLDSHERRLDPKLVAWLRSGTASAG